MAANTNVKTIVIEAWCNIYYGQLMPGFAEPVRAHAVRASGYEDQVASALLESSSLEAQTTLG